MTEYKRILLKLSGEALMGEDSYGINHAVMQHIVTEISEVKQLGVELAIVVGGGNIFRGMQSTNDGIERVTADHMGMLATVMNALALRDAIKQSGLVARVQSALNIEQIVEPYIRGKAIRSLQKGNVLIFAAGTGNPFFTTDTAAALRGMEMNVDIVLKATKVDGIYTADPVKDPSARKLNEISYKAVLEKGLKVMDATAVSLCMENRMPLLVFNMTVEGNIFKAISGETIGTIVKE